MSETTPEFSRLVPVASLGLEPFRQDITATAEERERLVRRLDLVALDRLTATVTLHRHSGGLIALEASFEAEFVQNCIVTLEPVAGAVVEQFALLYGPPEGEQGEIELEVDEPVFEPLSGDAVDIGEAVAQELSLALPEFPRDPDATIEIAGGAEPEGGPFAALEKLRGPRS